MGASVGVCLIRWYWCTVCLIRWYWCTDMNWINTDHHYTKIWILYSEVFLTLTDVFLTLTEGFPCFSLSCKANARVKLAKTGHRPHSSTLVVICVVRLIFMLFYVLFVCKCVLPPGDNPIAVNKYIISYIIYIIISYHISYHIISYHISYHTYHISYHIS
jgi:hypothetical protein